MKNLKLPKKYIEPSGNFDDFSVLIHGEKKIGKTDLANQSGKVLLLQHDPPQRAYRRMEIVCSDWKILRDSVKKLELMTKKKFIYDRVVIDGIGTAFERCLQWVCEKRGIDHPQDEGYGKGWSALFREFGNIIDRLLYLPCGIWFICHSEWKEVETSSGDEVTRLCPILSPKAEGIVNGKVDATFAYDYKDDGNRILIVKGSNRVIAGNRIDQPNKGKPHFRTIKGNRIHWIPMGSSAEEGHKNLMDAFNNKQRKTKP